MDVVSIRRHAVPAFPRSEKVPVSVKYQHRRPLPLEHVHPVLPVHGNAADAPKALSHRQPRPFRLILVHIFAHADGYRHIFVSFAPLRLRVFAFRIRHRRTGVDYSWDGACNIGQRVAAAPPMIQSTSSLDSQGSAVCPSRTCPM